MIRKFIHSMLGSGKKSAAGKLRVIPASAHNIRPEDLSDCALRVVRTLHEAGFKTYVVGGAVRDLLLEISPKDFDVATNATPDEVRRLIRRSRIIGRRFQIVHAICHDEVVEVSTFRGTANDDDRIE